MPAYLKHVTYGHTDRSDDRRLCSRPRHAHRVIYKMSMGMPAYLKHVTYGHTDRSDDRRQRIVASLLLATSLYQYQPATKDRQTYALTVPAFVPKSTECYRDVNLILCTSLVYGSNRHICFVLPRF